LPASDPGLRRVSVHAGNAVVDLALPAGIPVATIIPSIVDILGGRGVGGSDDVRARRYQLSSPGASALNASTTLADNGIQDGAVLLLTQSATPLPAPRYDDVAEAVSATLDAAARPRSHFRHRQATRLTGAVAACCLVGIGTLVLVGNTLHAEAFRDFSPAAGVAGLAGVLALLSAAIAHRTCRDAIAGLTLSVIATEFAAVAGFLAVPGHPGTPNVLLAATAAAVTSVLAMRVSGCGAVTLAAVSGVATVIAVAALVGVITAAPLRAIGSVSALASLGLLGLAARLSIVLAGLSPRLPQAPDRDTIEPGGARLAAKAIHADDWLTSLLAAFASSATVGAIVTVLAGEPRLCCIAFGTVTGALLLLRARSDDRTRAVMFVTGGIAITATTFGVVALSVPGHGAWIAAVTAMLAAAAIFVGFVAPAIPLSPVVRRGVEVLECLALVATVPLTGWICGFYTAVRGLNLK
jgi:type VII secretion integral membrane protein EccD